MTLYARPSDLLADTATSVTWQSGTPDSLYPIAQVKDRLSHTVTKVTGTTGTIRVTFSGAKTLQGVAVVNTNATAITLTNNAGLNVAIPIEATPLDLLKLDPWKDLRGVSNVSASQWDLAFTAATAVSVGEILLAETLRSLPILWSPSPSDRESHPAIVQRTDGYVKWKYGFGERARGFRGTARGDVRADILALERDAHGVRKNFLLIPDENKNDALFVDLATDVREIMYIAPGAGSPPAGPVLTYLHDVVLEFEEQQKGWI